MDSGALKLLCISASRQRKFLYMEYNSTWRNIHPYTVKKEGGVDYLYGWCELHAQKPVERFIVENIGGARVSADDDYINIRLNVEKFDEADDE